METQRLQKQPNRTRKIRSNTSLDDLPEDILHHIISFLPLNDAISSSSVARSWRNLWKSVPITTLYFDMNTFVSKIPPNSTSEYVRRLCYKFFRTVYHRSAFKKIKFIHGSENRFDTRSLLSIVKAANVVELELCYPYFAPYERSLFSGLRGSSVEVLKLHGINLLDPNYLIQGINHQLDSVRELHLEDFLITDKGIEALMASCVNLEILSLVTAGSDGLKCRSSDGFSLKKLKIVSRKLKHLKLHCPNVHKCKEFSVEIHAPSLKSLNFRAVEGYETAQKMKSPSLGEAKVVFQCTKNQRGFDYCTNLVSYLSVVEDCFAVQTLWPSQFQIGEKVFTKTLLLQNLKRVELLTEFQRRDILGLESMLKKCPKLATMILVNKYEKAYNLNDDYYLDDMPDIIFEIPQLKLVEMKAFGATNIEMCIVELLIKHGAVLEKIVAHSKQVTGPFYLFDVLRPDVM